MSSKREPAPIAPVAQVLPMLGLAHLDRPFDYLVDAEQDLRAVPGARLRVRFAGRLVDAFLLARLERSEHDGKLAWIERVVSAEPVLTPQIAELCRAVADRYAGTMSDVIRLAVPPRHARTEDEQRPPPNETPLIDPAPGLEHWTHYRGGPAFGAAVRDGRAPRAAWQTVPGEDWAARLAELIGHTVAGGRGVIAVVPDQRDLDRLEQACAGLGDRCVTLAAGLGPTARYRRWLAALRGQAQVVLGTRSAIFAPVHDPGLIIVWDDGDPSLDEPRAPYPHPREVAVIRSHQQQCALVIGGYARTAEAQALVAAGWMHDLVADRVDVRRRSPRVQALAEENRAVGNDPLVRLARVPEFAFRLARSALDAGRPVLISVPRRGYLPSLACAACRTHARCRSCHGPLAMAPDQSVSCRWCGRVDPAPRCAACGSTQIRALTIGAARTAEELGRAFRGVPVVTSDGSRVVDSIPDDARLVVATPGAEPIVAGEGYGTVIAVDTWAHLDREDLRAEEDAARHWFAIAALARSAVDGGNVVLLAENEVPAVQAVIRWDPVAFAADQLAQRTELGFPPAVTMAAVDGTPAAVRQFVDLLELPPDAGILGPVPLPPGVRGPAGGERTDRGARADEFERLLIRVDRRHGRELAVALSRAQARRTSAADTGPLRVQVDPSTIG